MKAANSVGWCKGELQWCQFDLDPWALAWASLGKMLGKSLRPGVMSGHMPLGLLLPLYHDTLESSLIARHQF